ncbi:hypothetical protein Bca4012_026280 [Brassica carinata]
MAGLMRLIVLLSILTWLNCRKLKSLSLLRLVTCQSSTCKSIPGNGCDGKTCLYRQPTPLGVTPAVTTGRVVQDRATVSKASLRSFTFSCAEEKHLRGLSPQVAGVLGLSPGRFPFWRQVTTAFNIIPKFALCLPSSGTGRFYIGGANYYRNNPVPMTLTPLKNIGSGNYLLSVQSIYVGGSPLSLNPSLLEGGAKLSTVVPYTVLQTDIYNALARARRTREEGYPYQEVRETSYTTSNAATSQAKARWPNCHTLPSTPKLQGKVPNTTASDQRTSTGSEAN